VRAYLEKGRKCQEEGTWRQQGNGEEEGRTEGITRSEDEEVLCGRAGTSLKGLWLWIGPCQSRYTAEGTVAHRRPMLEHRTGLRRKEQERETAVY